MAKTYRKRRGGGNGNGNGLTVNTNLPMANNAAIVPSLGNSGKNKFNFKPNLTVNTTQPVANNAPSVFNRFKKFWNNEPEQEPMVVEPVAPMTGGKRRKSKTRKQKKQKKTHKRK